MDRENLVVLVGVDDRATGTMEKLQAHREGVLHRAVSVVITNPRGEVLLQRRALGKYHSPGLWANTACTHPFPDEEPALAAARRLEQEMGLRADLQQACHFIYRAELEQGLIEHELDHVFLGLCAGDPRPDPQEVMGYRWMPEAELRQDLVSNPGAYVVWLPEILQRLASLRPPGV